MLDEGWRRRERGTDVVIGYVESHNRPLTEAQMRDLEIVPRITREYRGAHLEEMDLEAVLARNPQVALVDELAHTNAPGGTHPKRWQDVEDLLNAGIDVITTVNIQHLESVNDVVEKITGISQQETIPDAIVRAAEQVELVDITPEALRRRMAHGNIYAADKIDVSLSNYFRTGNLSALRELALLWLADRVEDALQRYLDDNAIAETWETRERLIVGVTGSEVDEMLLRRATRIASRTGADLIAVHVLNPEGSLHGPPDTSKARELVEEFDGTFQQIVDDDIATALVSFARSERGTQIVLGAARPKAAFRPPSGVVEKVLRNARDLDVHVIAVGGERPARVRQRRQKSQLTWRRRILGLCVAVVVMPLLTVAMTSAHANLSLSTVFLVYLLAVLALTTWGGVMVGIVSALGASALENYYFVPPVHTLEVARPDDVVSLVAFLLFASVASVVVSRYTQRSNEAVRARAEAEILSKAAARVATTHDEMLPLLDSLRAVFAAPSVALIARRGGEWVPDLESGDELADLQSGARFVIDDDHALIVQGVDLDAQDRELVGAFAGRIAAGLRSISIVQSDAQLRAIAEAEALRTGLLRTVVHDLNEPLVAIGAKVASLLEKGLTLTREEHRDVLTEMDAELRRLSGLVANMVDVGRLETGVVEPQSIGTAVDELLHAALKSIDTQGRTLDIDMSDDLPGFITDPVLAERVIAVVLHNACRFNPVDQPVRINAGVSGGFVQILVIDRGPGIPPAKRAAILAPVRRRNDDQSGADLGLAVASGFAELLGGHLRFEDTPGGGLTVVIELPAEIGVEFRNARGEESDSGSPS
jgi:two-component system sensor histidine kinase KdpD